jgi:hypothetical protein
MENAEIYPVDATALSKGDLISPEQIERCYGITRDDSRYPFRQMELAKYVEKEKRLAGDPVVVKSEGLGVRILTDAEAVEYTNRRYEAHIAGLGYELARGLSVDVKNLDGPQKAQHERNLIVNGHTFSGTLAARKEAAKQLVYKRNEPKVIDPPTEL